MNPLVSIIIPNYNKEKFIKETLESVINQVYSSWEVLIVDDFSKDNSRQIIEEIAKSEVRIKTFFQTDNIGASACRNIGLANAKGEFVFFLDSDDLIINSCLKDRIDFIKSSDFAVFNTSTFYNKIGDSSFHWKTKEKNYLNQFLAHDLPWNISSVLWKRSAIVFLNGFNEGFKRLQDVELHTRALLSNLNFNISFNNEPDFFYRIDEERKGKNILEIQQNALQGYFFYYEFFSKYLIKCNKTEKLKFLKGTIFHAVKNVLIFRRIDKVNAKILWNSSLPYINELDKISRYYIKFYAFLFRVGFHRIMGFNYLMNRTFIDL